MNIFIGFIKAIKSYNNVLKFMVHVNKHYTLNINSWVL